MNDLLIYVRAIHFAATISVAGVAFFAVFIAEPAFREAENGGRVPAMVRRRLAWIAWVGLAVAVASGAAWLVLIAQSMSDSPLTEVFSEGVLWTVLLRTRFGSAWLARFALAGLLAAVFAAFLSEGRVKSLWIKTVVVALAAGFVGTLAWAGHAAGGLGLAAILHPAADFLHLVAAAAWVGTLVPLALLLAAPEREPAAIAIAQTATLRFSTFGVASVGTLLITGSINARYLAGSISALAATDYGHLLLMKVALFLGMVAVAAINRFRLKPRLVQNASATAAQDALRQLRRNTLIEIVMGATIIAIVAVLGVTPPGLHANHSH